MRWSSLVHLNYILQKKIDTHCGGCYCERIGIPLEHVSAADEVQTITSDFESVLLNAFSSVSFFSIRIMVWRPETILSLISCAVERVLTKYFHTSGKVALDKGESPCSCVIPTQVPSFQRTEGDLIVLPGPFNELFHIVHVLIGAARKEACYDPWLPFFAVADVHGHRKVSATDPLPQYKSWLLPHRPNGRTLR